jgi:electron transfer flavoprotein alpha subunit
MSLAKGVWILAEQRQGQLENIALEVISGGRQLADELEEEVRAVVIGSHDEQLAGMLASYGADRVYFIESPLLSEYSAELYVEVLAKLFEDESPEIVLCGATFMVRDLAPRLAARLKTGLVSECSNLAINEKGLLLQTKLTHGGKVSSTVVCPNSKPQMATVKPGAMSIRKPDTTRRPEVKLITPQLGKKESRCRVIGFMKADPEKVGLDEADVIVAGGRGLGSADNFQLITRLARSLGGVVAASLGAIDEGWTPRRSLIGQTGMTVTPKLYVACGISGSIYHVMGMKDSKFIVAINKDQNAPIFNYADMGIVGDVREIIPAIATRLEALSSGLSRQGERRSSA